MSLGSMDNPNAISNMLGFLDSEERNLNINFTKEILQLNVLIKTNLNSVLGEKAKYFDVRVEPRGLGVEISVVANDVKGTFIYSGTSAHDIISSYQPMPMPDGGFSRSVRHPGTQPMKEQIDQAIISALRTSGMF
jgi:hypothetical protein